MKPWEVMKAYEEGAELEVFSPGGGKWRNCTDPVWNWALRKYRVKPKKPEQIEINVWLHDDGGIAMTQEDTRDNGFYRNAGNYKLISQQTIDTIVIK